MTGQPAAAVAAVAAGAAAGCLKCWMLLFVLQ